jgi:polyisoprenoid-binding protein YceI
MSASRDPLNAEIGQNSSGAAKSRTSHEFVPSLRPVTGAKTAGAKTGMAMSARFRLRNMPPRHGGICRRRVSILTLALLCCFAPGVGTAAQGAAQGWRIDETHTWIGFKIDAVGFPTTRGHFTRYSGRILIDFARPAKSFTSFTVDSASVDVGSQSFNDFVKSPALLDTERFPTLSFTSTRIEKLDPRTALVTGNLTMLGVTRPITLTVNVDADSSTKGRPVTFVATTTIMRSQFGMIFGLPLIDDALEITVKTRALTDE